MSDLPDEISRINALTSNARNTWFALLGVLVFVGITLMGVEHIDFYGVNRATKLPLVNVEVPTFYFFVAAPILTAAIYGYFHLYLIRLWDALGEVPARVEDKPIGDLISPWLVSDAALHFRNRVRKDNCSTPRTLEGGAMLLNFLLAWLFGLIILYFLWRLSLPARAFWMSAIACLSFIVSIIVATSSIAMMAKRMRRPPGSDTPRLWSKPLQVTGVLIGSLALLYESYESTEGSPSRLASLDMIDEQVVARPGNWLDYDFAKAEFRAAWCRRENVDCSDLGGRKDAFTEEWLARRHATLFVLNFPVWHKIGRAKPDLRKARMYSAFLAGANLWGARMSRAVLDHAQMEKTALNFAKMDGIRFWSTHLEQADMSYSYISAPPLHFKNLDEAHLSAALNVGGAMRAMSLEGVIFDERTDFRNVFLDGSVTVPASFARQMGTPCQWIDETLDDAQFYAVWRWWVESNPTYDLSFNQLMWRENVAPAGWEEVTPADATLLEQLELTDCKWKTDPISTDKELPVAGDGE